MDLSIIIVSWNVRDFLDRCLDSISRNVTGLSYEVIVVDNASHDATLEMIASKHPRTRVIANTTNAGFCRGNNQGIEIACGDFLVLLNPDTEVYGGAMEALVAFLREHPDAGVVGPMLLSPDNLTMPNGTTFPHLKREVLGVLGLHSFRKKAYDLEAYGRDDFTKLAEVDVVCGACLLARREVFDQIGGLDEQLFMFFEEVDFCLRARKAGWRVFYVPEARVYHHWMQSVKQDIIGATRRLFRSQYLYFRKHHGLAQALILRVLSTGTIAARAARIRGGRARNRLLAAMSKRRAA